MWERMPILSFIFRRMVGQDWHPFPPKEVPTGPPVGTSFVFLTGLAVVSRRSCRRAFLASIGLAAGVGTPFSRRLLRAAEPQHPAPAPALFAPVKVPDWVRRVTR